MLKNMKLFGYNRFFLNNIEKIDYSPASQIQLILGSNGSGKSSLLKEINPLPINKNDFKEDGYKIIQEVKDNRNYLLKSTVTKNSFIVDDVELNSGGTKKVQLSLVYDHFKLTPKSNDVLLNVTKLTNMSTNERKEWLRQMSTVDYGYSIYLYNDLKQKLRDVIGFIKIINSELTHDIKLTENITNIDTVKKDISILKEHIEYLTLKYNNNALNKKDIVTDHNKLNEFNILLSKNVNLLNKESIGDLALISATTVKDIDIELERLRTDIDNMEIFDKSSEELEYLKKELTNYFEYFDKLKKKEDLLFDPESCEEISQAIKKNTVIADTILELGYYDEIKLTKTNYEEVKTKKSNITFSFNTKSKLLSNLEGEYKSHSENHTEDNKVTCKKCGDISYFGYEENKHKDLETKIANLKEDIEKLDVDQQEANVLLGKYEAKINLISILKDAYYSLNLVPHWNSLFKDTIGSCTSQQIFFINKKITDEIDSYKDYKKMTKEYNDITYRIKLDNDVLEAHKKHVAHSKDKLIERVVELQETRRANMSQIEKYKVELQLCEKFDEIKNYFNEQLKVYKHNVSCDVKTKRNSIIKDVILDLKNTLIKLEDVYNNYERIKNKVETNKTLIAQYEAKKIALEKTVKALSPTEGLIAKSINSFINKFLSEMNIIINSVWSYDITLLPCQVSDDNDLDYMFSVLVDDRQPIKDVSMLSSSMKDIVDLSFRIVFMKYMGLTHMPLILDEFGVTMDDKHRYNCYNIIEHTLANNFEQVFITAHFKSIYSRFLDSDIIVLDDKNLDLDKTAYNINIVIN